MERKWSVIQKMQWFFATLIVCVYFFVSVFPVGAVSIFWWDSVVDAAWVLSQDDEGVLEQTVAQIRRETSAEIAIVLMDDLWWRDIFDVAMNLARNEDSEISWKDTDADESSRGVWNEKYDNWVVVVVAPSERKRYILVWRGLEWAIPDARVKRLGEQILVPAFRSEEYGEWLFWLLQALSWLISWEAEYRDMDWSTSSGLEVSDLLVAYIFIILFFGPFVKKFLETKKKKYIWSWVWSGVMSLVGVWIIWWAALWLLVPLGFLWLLVLFAEWRKGWWWFSWWSFWWGSFGWWSWWGFSWWFGWWSFSWWWAWWSW